MSEMSASSFHASDLRDLGDPVRAVSVASTGEVEIHPDHAGLVLLPAHDPTASARLWAAAQDGPR